MAAVRQGRCGHRAARTATPDGPVFLRTLAERTGGDLIVFDEALTTSPLVTRYLPAERPGDYHLTRGGSLGCGFPGAVGAKLARPDRLVVGFAGDGGP